MSEFKHGNSGYTNHGCRCDVCTEGNTRRQADYMARSPEQREKHRLRARARHAARKGK